MYAHHFATPTGSRHRELCAAKHTVHVNACAYAFLTCGSNDVRVHKNDTVCYLWACCFLQVKAHLADFEADYSAHCQLASQSAEQLQRVKTIKGTARKPAKKAGEASVPGSTVRAADIGTAAEGQPSVEIASRSAAQLVTALQFTTPAAARPHGTSAPADHNIRQPFHGTESAPTNQALPCIPESSQEGSPVHHGSARPQPVPPSHVPPLTKPTSHMQISGVKRPSTSFPETERHAKRSTAQHSMPHVEDTLEDVQNDSQMPMFNILKHRQQVGQAPGKQLQRVPAASGRPTSHGDKQGHTGYTPSIHTYFGKATSTVSQPITSPATEKQVSSVPATFHKANLQDRSSFMGQATAPGAFRGSAPATGPRATPSEVMTLGDWNMPETAAASRHTNQPTSDVYTHALRDRTNSTHQTQELRYPPTDGLVGGRKQDAQNDPGETCLIYRQCPTFSQAFGTAKRRDMLLHPCTFS